MAVERVLSNLNLISFKTEGGLQNHIDELQDGDLVFTPDSSLKGNLFDFKWTDHKLNDISWLNADTFSWQSGDVYVAAYEHLLADIDERTTETETVGGVTISFYRAEDGHKICPPDQESNLQALYNAGGAAWYYILDTDNIRFKLPRANPDKNKTFAGADVSVRGDGKTLGLFANGSVSTLKTRQNDGTTQLLTYNATIGVAEGNRGINSGATNAYSIGVTTDASLSGLTGTADLLNAWGANKGENYLYFYVGNFTQTALENTAGINTELFNGKADTDLSNLTSAGKEKLSIKSYSVTGEMFNASTDSVAGTGSARVYLMPYGKVIIDFVIRITTGGTSSSEFNCGLNRDLLRYLNNNIPVITPLGGTYAHYNTSGYLSQSKTGYGGNLAKAGQFWQFGRVYQTDGKTGGWPASNFAKDEYLVGTAWGTYEI